MLKLDYRVDDDDHAFYVVNKGDSSGDDLSNLPDALRELRESTNALILQAARKPHNVVVKVRTRHRPPTSKVRGYATFAHFLQGATPRQFEKMLGFKEGALSDGCCLYYVDHLALTPDNIAPRGSSKWPGGVTPRDLQRMNDKLGVEGKYDPDYPPASDPIFQFVIFREVKARLARVLNDRDSFDDI